jgi:hypothetical protein
MINVLNSGAIRLYAGKSSGASVYAATLQPRLDQALKEIEEAGLYKVHTISL